MIKILTLTSFFLMFTITTAKADMAQKLVCSLTNAELASGGRRFEINLSEFKQRRTSEQGSVDIYLKGQEGPLEYLSITFFKSFDPLTIKLFGEYSVGLYTFPYEPYSAHGIAQGNILDFSCIDNGEYILPCFNNTNIQVDCEFK